MIKMISFNNSKFSNITSSLNGGTVTPNPGPVVIICIARFNVHKFYVLPTQLYLCVLCGSENKQLLFPYTALIGFITETECVYCAVRTGYLYIILYI